MTKVSAFIVMWLSVLLMIVPGTMTMAEDPPAIRVQPTGDDGPAAGVPAPPATGAMDAPPPPAGSWGVVSEGDGGGGIFRDVDSDAEAWLGSESIGVHGFGVQAGGFFADTDNTAHAYVGYLGWGIGGYGFSAGAYFEDIDGSGRAWVGKDNYGVEGQGSAAGGYFVNSGGSGSAFVGGYYWGIEAHGNGGGYFVDGDGPAFAAVGHDDYGIEAYGPNAGGHFGDNNGTGQAWVGHGDGGIEARGTFAGGLFEDIDGSGRAYVGYGDVGIDASGSGAGGIFQNTNTGEEAWLAAGGGFGVQGFGTEGGAHFENTQGTGYANVASDVWGIEAHGATAGGYFGDLDGTGEAYVGYSGVGIESRGSEAGGYFEDSDGSGQAYVGVLDSGIEGMGDEAGGTFRNLDGTSLGSVAVHGSGIDAEGTLYGGRFDHSGGEAFANLAYHLGYGVQARGTYTGGSFADLDGSGSALVGVGELGINARGNEAGGFFRDGDSSGSAYVGYGDRGVQAYGDGAGGHFEDTDEGTYSNVAISTYSIHGNGTKAFVQNHPYDRDAVIVYTAPEGDEVATYTRGTARLVGGEATVRLAETFKWVTNPDIGLTAHLTPREEPIALAVVDLSTEEMVVRASGDAPDGLVFDYIVYGLRIGFEESSVVQEKEREAYIPSMAEHRRLYQRRPDLMRFNSMERFKVMQHTVHPEAKVDLSRGQALRDAIIEFDPAVHEMSRPRELDELVGNDATDRYGDAEGRAQGRKRDRTVGDGQAGPLTSTQSGFGGAIPVDGEGNVYATSFRPSSQDLASLLAVSEPVEPGDVLVIDRNNPGMMRRAFEASDAGVVGVVAADAGVVLGTVSTTAGESGITDNGGDDLTSSETGSATSPSLRAPVAFAGVVRCKVDASYGAVWPGDLLVTSPNPGHAMRTDAPLPGTMLGKALEPLAEGTAAIRVLVMLR